MFHVRHTAMATVFEVRGTCQDPDFGRQAARAAFDVVDRLERMLSRFIENSDISRINHLVTGESATVGYETMQCLQLARLMAAETAGAFDISLGTGFESLELVPEEFRVVARADGVQLDLGALGKGYAVDRMADVLEDWEVSRVLIHAGASSVLALDPPDEQADWPLSLTDPRDPAVLVARIGASQRAFGASGIRKGDHIVDPRTGAPVRSRRAAWVSAPRPALIEVGRHAGAEPSPTALADALSTAFMVCPPEAAGAYCRAHAGLEAWILEDELRYFAGPKWAATG